MRSTERFAVRKYELNGNFERFARNFWKPLPDLLKSNVVRPLARDLAPAIDPRTTERAVPIKNNQRPLWSMLDHKERLGCAAEPLKPDFDLTGKVEDLATQECEVTDNQRLKTNSPSLTDDRPKLT